MTPELLEPKPRGNTVSRNGTEQFGIEGRSSTKFLLNLCTQAKNMTLTRNGMSPEQAVFGRSLRWPLVGTTDEDEIPLAALGTDGETVPGVRRRDPRALPHQEKKSSPPAGGLVSHGCCCSDFWPLGLL